MSFRLSAESFNDKSDITIGLAGSSDTSTLDLSAGTTINDHLIRVFGSTTKDKAIDTERKLTNSSLGISFVSDPYEDWSYKVEAEGYDGYGKFFTITNRSLNLGLTFSTLNWSYSAEVQGHKISVLRPLTDDIEENYSQLILSTSYYGFNNWEISIEAARNKYQEGISSLNGIINTINIIDPVAANELGSLIDHEFSISAIYSFKKASLGFRSSRARLFLSDDINQGFALIGSYAFNKHYQLSATVNSSKDPAFPEEVSSSGSVALTFSW